MKKIFFIWLTILLVTLNVIEVNIIMKDRKKMDLMSRFADLGFDHWNDCNLMNIEDGRLDEYIIAGVCLADQEPWEVNERYHRTYTINGVDQPE